MPSRCATAWSEDVNDVSRLHGTRLVLNSASNHEAVAGTHVDRLAGARNFEMSGDHVDNLFVGMAVRCANPTFFHTMLRQEQLVVVRAHAARQSRFR